MQLPWRIASTLAVRTGSAIASLLLAAVLIRVYSLGRFGEFSFAFATVKTIAAFSLFSLDSLLLRMLVRQETISNPRMRVRVIAECAGAARALGLAGTMIIAVVAAAFWRGESFGFWASILLLAPIIFLHGSTATQAALLRSTQRDAESQLVAFGVPAIAPVILITLGWMAGYTPILLPEISALVAHAAASLVGFLLTGVSPFAFLGGGLRQFSKKRLKIVQYSSSIHLANAMNYLSDWYGPMLISVFHSFESVGILRIFQQFGSAFGLASISLEIPFSTEIGRAHIQNQLEKLSKLLLVSQIAIGAFGIGIGAIISVSAETIFQFFEISFSDYRFYLFLILFFYVVALFAGASASALNIMDCAGRLVRASGIAMLLAIIVQSALIPFFGLIGAVLGIGLAISTRAFINYIFVRAEIRERRKYIN